MQLSSIPQKFPVAFAASATSGYIHYPVPTAPTGDPNQASLDLGFPPATMTSPGYPEGQDFNGILKQITLWNQWQAAGANAAPYDSAFSTAIGGYPKTAVLSAAQPGQFWYSTVDNNTSDPDTGGSGWVGFSPLPIFAADSGSANAVQITTAQGFASLAATKGYHFTVTKVAIANTGATTFQITDASANVWSANLVQPDGSALVADNLPASVVFTCVGTGTTFILESPTPAPAPTPQTSLCWAICQGTSTPGAVTIIDSSGNVTVTRTSTSGQYTIATNFTIGNGFACPMPDNTNSLAGWGTHNSGPSGTTFTFGFENRGGGGSLDPSTFFIEINGGP